MLNAYSICEVPDSGGPYNPPSSEKVKEMRKIESEIETETANSMDRYSMNIRWSDEDNCFIATCEAFPGLSAFGDTRVEAVKEAETALELFIEDYEDTGEELPQPNVIDY